MLLLLNLEARNRNKCKLIKKKLAAILDDALAYMKLRRWV
jgi:hypothetical protein